MTIMTQERKKPIERAPYTLRLNPEVIAQVDEEAESDRRNRQVTVEILLEEALAARRHARQQSAR